MQTSAHPPDPPPHRRPGAGKTTTLSILAGDLSPTRGTALICAEALLALQLPPRTPAAPSSPHTHRPAGPRTPNPAGGRDVALGAGSRLVGWCPQFDGLLELLTVREHVELFGRIKGVAPEAALAAEADALLRRLDLRAFERAPAGSLSGGNRRKLSLACAMVGAPPVLILDEPSTGMDPAARRFMWGVVAEAAQAGNTAVILTTHRRGRDEHGTREPGQERTCALIGGAPFYVPLPSGAQHGGG